MSLLTALRVATRDAHASIERLIPLVHEPPTRAAYVDYLRAMYGFLVPVEAALSTLPASFADEVSLHARLKSARLAEDLRALDATEIPTCPRTPRIDGPSDGYGVLYVLEGSTLGAQVILRSIASVPGLASATRYLGSYGRHVGEMWRAFCEALEAHGDVSHHGRVVEAAMATFRDLEAWLVHTANAR